jgi:hypothetical protein
VPILKRQTITKRFFIDKFLKVIDLRRWYARKKISESIKFTNSDYLKKFNEWGVVNYQTDFLSINSILDQVFIFCQSKLNDHKNLQQNRSDKSYLQHILRRDDFENKSPVMTLAFNKKVVGLVASFLNDFPVIADIALLYSPPSSQKNSNDFTGSQLFHMDADDTRLCKLWFILEDVSFNDGPTVVVSKMQSKVIAKKLKYRKGGRIKEDSLVTKKLPCEQLITITGEKKSVIFIDTANCFHYGSRVGDTSKGRFMLMISYSTTYALEHGLFGKSSPMAKLSVGEIKSDLNPHMRKMLVDSNYF